MPDFRYIADGAAPLSLPQKVTRSLVAHSPADSKYRPYMKQKGHLGVPLYMPFWEVHELEKLRERLYYDLVSAEEVGARGPPTVLETAALGVCVVLGVAPRIPSAALLAAGVLTGMLLGCTDAGPHWQARRGAAVCA